MKIKNFQVGQIWRRRDWRCVRVASVDYAAEWPVITKDGFVYKANGRFWSSGRDAYDLVALVKDVDEIAGNAAPAGLRQRLADAAETAEREAHELSSQAKAMREQLTELSDKSHARYLDAVMLRNMLLELDHLSKPL